MHISEVVLHQGVQDRLSLPPGSIPEMVRMLALGDPGRQRTQAVSTGAVSSHWNQVGLAQTDLLAEEAAPKEETGSSC